MTIYITKDDLLTMNAEISQGSRDNMDAFSLKINKLPAHHLRSARDNFLHTARQLDSQTRLSLSSLLADLANFFDNSRAMILGSASEDEATVAVKSMLDVSEKCKDLPDVIFGEKHINVDGFCQNIASLKMNDFIKERQNFLNQLREMPTSERIRTRDSLILMADYLDQHAKYLGLSEQQNATTPRVSKMLDISEKCKDIPGIVFGAKHINVDAYCQRLASMSVNEWVKEKQNFLKQVREMSPAQQMESRAGLEIMAEYLDEYRSHSPDRNIRQQLITLISPASSSAIHATGHDSVVSSSSSSSSTGILLHRLAVAQSPADIIVKTFGTDARKYIEEINRSHLLDVKNLAVGKKNTLIDIILQMNPKDRHSAREDLIAIARAIDTKMGFRNKITTEVCDILAITQECLNLPDLHCKNATSINIDAYCQHIRTASPHELVRAQDPFLQSVADMDAQERLDASASLLFIAHAFQKSGYAPTMVRQMENVLAITQRCRNLPDVNGDSVDSYCQKIPLLDPAKLLRSRGEFLAYVRDDLSTDERVRLKDSLNAIAESYDKHSSGYCSTTAVEVERLISADHIEEIELPQKPAAR